MLDPLDPLDPELADPLVLLEPFVPDDELEDSLLEDEPFPSPLVAGSLDAPLGPPPLRLSVL